MDREQLHTDDQGVYFRARHRVERLKKYYSHLLIYMIINLIVASYKIARNMNNGETFSEAFFDLNTFTLSIIWGIILFIHTISVFGLFNVLGKDWEERKLREFMNNDQD